MNCKIVLLKGPWWREALSHLSFLFPINAFVDTPGSNYQYVEYPSTEKRTAQLPGGQRGASKDRLDVAEEDIATGGDYIKVLLLPKHFTPEFRENWEIYRAEYWIQENQRRAELRKQIRARDRALAKQEGLWFWRFRLGRKLKRTPSQPRSHAIDRMAQSHSHSLSHSSSQKEKHRRTASVMKEKEGTHSRSSSRSSVGSKPEQDERERRWSTSTTGSMSGDLRRRKLISTVEAERRGSVPSRKISPSTGSRPVTPVESLRPRSSNLSSMSSGSEGDSPGRRIKAEPMD
jgi:hypothetical protein